MGVRRKMKRDCNTCICKEGSCYPSTTIFDKDKTCKSYYPDYEGYIADLEKENAELKDYRLTTLAKQQTENQKYTVNLEHKLSWYDDQLTKAKEIIRELVEWANWQGNSKCPSFKSIQDKAEQFLSEVEK